MSGGEPSAVSSAESQNLHPGPRSPVASEDRNAHRAAHGIPCPCGLCLVRDTPLSAAARVFQVGDSFSLPVASGAALMNIAIGGTKAVLQLKEIIGVHVGEEAAAGQAMAPDRNVGVFKCLLQHL